MSHAIWGMYLKLKKLSVLSTLNLPGVFYCLWHPAAPGQSASRPVKPRAPTQGAAHLPIIPQFSAVKDCASCSC